MHVSVFRVDAFTDTIFAGNPAAVCPLASWPEDALLQAIAAENNLSETAYFVPQGDNFGLRWFTPKCEVNLCGHATLASGFVILNILHPDRESVRFETRSGTLTVARDAERLAMDLPARPPWACADPPAELAEGLQASAQASAVLQIKDNYFVVYGSEETIRRIAPDLALLGNFIPSASPLPLRERTLTSCRGILHPVTAFPKIPSPAQLIVRWRPIGGNV